MEQATPVINDLARLLLAVEAQQSGYAEENVYAALSVFAKLRMHLSRLVGVAGYQALFTRALALAKSEVPWLEPVRVQTDATLEGFGEAAQGQTAEAAAEGSVALLGQLLGLLVTFIGETITLRLVADVWPDIEKKINLLQHEGGPA